ncbi:MAG: shikimate dehydrogenase [Bacteroidetes bacterium]|jgi:shikimate dehydrogenase|nr:shikimate dehydrogenase [Bacteroidota bacterium]
MRLFGLIGYPLSHSFSKKFFTDKFSQEKISDCSYENFELNAIELFPDLISHYQNICGLNVTIPYKTAIIPYLTQLDKVAAETGAVNTIKFQKSITIGCNTDVIGFRQSIELYVKNNKPQALVLGTGGSAKAVTYVLRQLDVPFQMVSRTMNSGVLHYSQLTKEIILSHQLIINCTPSGRYPEIHSSPPIPYSYLTKNHLLYDLNYNPSQTLFLAEGLKRDAQTKNGMEMLIKQAEASWQIWND